MAFSDLKMLFPLSLVYNAVTRARLRGYQSGLFPIFKLPVPVISVGNLTTGGTGKTPLVEWICRKIAAEGKRVAVLTRGYGRVNPKSQVVVSNGTEILASEREAGDEPLLLAENLLGIAAVMCNPNRIAAGQWAIENLGTQVFVLDDGFQHLRLARDLNIVTIDATEPWGGGSLLPQGRLREPKKSLARADCAVITRTDQVEDLNGIHATIQEFAGATPIFTSSMLMSGLMALNGDRVDSIPEPTGAFCGIGNPESFFNQLRSAGYTPAFTRAFSDHYQYNQSDVDALVRESNAKGVASLIATAKDAIKLRSLTIPIPCYVFKIEISIEDESGFVDLMRNAIFQAGATKQKPDR